MNYWTFELFNNWTIELFSYWNIEFLNYWTIELLNYWTTILLISITTSVIRYSYLINGTSLRKLVMSGNFFKFLSYWRKPHCFKFSLLEMTIKTKMLPQVENNEQLNYWTFELLNYWTNELLIYWTIEL